MPCSYISSFAEICPVFPETANLYLICLTSSMNHTLYLFCSMLHAILCLLVHILVSFRMNMTEDQGLGSIQVQIPSLSNSSKALLLLLLLSRFSRVRLCVTPQIAAHQAPPSLGFSRQEHWSGLPFPSPMHESEK